MQIFIVIHGSPWASQAGSSALQFADAAIAAGHAIYRVFFYHDAVLTASAPPGSSQEQTSMGRRWGIFSREHGTELVVCISAALRRGIQVEGEGDDQQQPVSLLPGFEVAGLGQYVDGVLRSDRTISFGG